MAIHHIGIAVADMDRSLEFYRDGLGCQVIFEQRFDRDWQRLVDTPAETMRAVVLAHIEDPSCPIELIAFDDGVKRTPCAGPPTGIFLFAFHTSDVVATRARLAALGYDKFEESYSDIGGKRIDVTFVRDPDGVVIELVSTAQVQDVPLVRGQA
jgi:catechol 2,3-dioxygenase-like lactoylglutathione lyase family enzyme